MRHLFMLGGAIRSGGVQFEPWQVPYSPFEELDPLAAMEAELEENVQRRDLTWQERADAKAKLHELRLAQAAQNNSRHTLTDTAREIYGEENITTSWTGFRDELVVANFLNDPDVVKAKTVKEALKVIKAKETKARHAAIGATLPGEVLAEQHRLLVGDFRQVDLASDFFDVVLCDPPYGIGVDKLNRARGIQTATHDYDDSNSEKWKELMVALGETISRVLKPDAHFFMFCDIEHFLELRELMTGFGFRCGRKPMIMCKTSSVTNPISGYGPWIAWESILYGMRGDKPIQQMKNDWFVVSGDHNLGMAAQKPVESYVEILKRVCAPGEKVIDLTCGTGPIFPAAHELKLIATGVELNPTTASIAAERLKGLE
jgi:site-specific DNA-methyltransferase (adenine-specific)